MAFSCILSRGIPGNALRAFPGSFRNFFRKVPAVLGVCHMAQFLRFLCGSSLFNSFATQRFHRDLTIKFIGTGARTTPIIEICPLTEPPFGNPKKTPLNSSHQVQLPLGGRKIMYKRPRALQKSFWTPPIRSGDSSFLRWQNLFSGGSRPEGRKSPKQSRK